jgi:very-short-patch-repair endonuclease
VANSPNPHADGPPSGDIGRLEARRHVKVRDHAIAEIAGRQHGVVTLAQLREIGLGKDAVSKRLEAGRLFSVFRCVYAVGQPILMRDSWLTAAVLACGPGAVLSHQSAASLWGLSPSRGAIDVTAPNRRGRIPAGIRAHRDGSLTPADRTSVRGIPCTSVARTLLDLAGTTPVWRLADVVEEAEVARLLDRPAVRELLKRSRGRRGVARLRTLVDDLDPKIKFTRSRLERRFLRMCERAQIPRPQVNVLLDLGGERVQADFLWRDARLVVETDGRESHETATAFDRDRRRDQQLSVAGWRVIRCTWHQVINDPMTLAPVLKALLSSPTGLQAET